MKKTLKRTIALAMALAVLLSFSCVQALAASTVKSKRTIKNIVYIGDSIAAGYALNSFIKEDPYTLENLLTFTGDKLIEGSYPQLVSDAIGAENSYKLAREAWTTKNVLRILDPTYEEELSKPENYYDRFESEYTFYDSAAVYPFEVDEMRETAPEAIANADVVTINLGNNDCFTMSVQEPIIRSMYYAWGMSAQSSLTMLKGTYQMPTTLDEVAAMYGSYNIDLFEVIDQNTAAYEANYDRLVGRILELNPDVEIYVIGMSYLFENTHPDGALKNLLVKKNKALTKELKTHYTQRSVYKDRITYVNVNDTKPWWSFSLYNPLYYATILISVHPDYEGHQYMANRLIKAMNKNA